jgi:hypothetical protein
MERLVLADDVVGEAATDDTGRALGDGTELFEHGGGDGFRSVVLDLAYQVQACSWWRPPSPVADSSQGDWESANPGDRDHMPTARRLLHVVADRIRWRRLLEESRRRAAGIHD